MKEGNEMQKEIDSLRQAVENMCRIRAQIEDERKRDIKKAQERYLELGKAYEKYSVILHGILLKLEESEYQTACIEEGKQLYAALTQKDLLLKDFNIVQKETEQFSKHVLANTTVWIPNAATIGRQMNILKMGYYPTEEQNVKLIKSKLLYPENRRVSLLDPCCGCGTALKLMADEHIADTYGIEIDNQRASLAQDKLMRVGLGSFFESRVEHEAFQLLFLNPPYM
jgi:methylase of polypeptide subunit release factors